MRKKLNGMEWGLKKLQELFNAKILKAFKGPRQYIFFTRSVFQCNVDIEITVKMQLYLVGGGIKLGCLNAENSHANFFFIFTKSKKIIIK